MLYFNLIIVFAVLFFGINHLTSKPLALYEKIGLVLSFGIVLGTNGINVAHELGHRKTKWERFLAKLLLMPSLYMHFYIEHNFGHHLNVGTPDDPATSKKSISIFILVHLYNRSNKKCYSYSKEPSKKQKSWVFSVYNDFFYYQIFQIIFLICVYMLFGTQGVIFSLFIALVGVLLLETINYIEHYGLSRKPNGSRYERVSPMHSWNSNHAIGRLVLYELTRHSDHHHRASKNIKF